MLRVPTEVWGAICGITFGICLGVGVCGLLYFEWGLRTTAGTKDLNMLILCALNGWFRTFLGVQAVTECQAWVPKPAASPPRLRN